jgi:hypothetical protein
MLLEELFKDKYVFEQIKLQVLAHKKILSSDPVVGKMNKIRWILDYMAVLDEKEVEIKILKSVLTGVFGLNLVPKELEKKGVDILPLVYFVAPEVVEKILEGREAYDQAEEEGKKKLPQISELSIDTFFSEEDKKKALEEKLKFLQEENRKLGVKIMPKEELEKQGIGVRNK